jgi:hypothetical protein
VHISVIIETLLAVVSFSYTRLNILYYLIIFPYMLT